VFLFNNCTIDVLYNQAVKVIGSIQQVKVKDRLLPHIFVGLEPDGCITNGLNHIEPVEKIESIEITGEDKKKFNEFRIQNEDKILDALARLVAPRGYFVCHRMTIS
jgi:hypothetical protein